jgi:hypothetical protein
VTIETPILLVVYRRADAAAAVMQAIAPARPRRLLVAADGPAHPGERAACDAAREAATRVDWPCDVSTDFASQNLGCRRRVISAIDWLFSTEQRGIIIEDDCVPSADFFRFCECLLDRHADDERVVHISGETYQTGRRSADSYYFSKYPLTWGWATWRRAWQHFDERMDAWPSFLSSPEHDALYDTADERRYWDGTFQLAHDGKLSTTWDYPWWFACMTQGLSIHPAVNLVSNIGSGPSATHSGDDRSLLHRPVRPLDDPLRHPRWVVRNRAADMETFDARLPGAILKRQRTWRHQAGRPHRWASRMLRRMLGGAR